MRCVLFNSTSCRCPLCEPSCFVVDLLPSLMCEAIVSYIVGFDVGRASWSMHWSHDVCIFLDRVVVAFGSFRCSWDVRSVRVAMSVDSASSSLPFGRCWSPLCRLACIGVAFSIYMLACSYGVVCSSNIAF